MLLTISTGILSTFNTCPFSRTFDSIAEVGMSPVEHSFKQVSKLVKFFRFSKLKYYLENRNFLVADFCRHLLSAEPQKA